MTSSTNPKRFILLGDAGAGKSSFINFLYNLCYGTQKPVEVFCDQPKVKLAIPCANWLDCLDREYSDNHSERDINDQTQSQTQKCTTYTLRNNETHLELIDTPGFSDSNGTNADEHNLKLIEETLKSLSYLNGIILVVNGARPRLGLSFKNFLHLLHQVWPNDLLNNCVAVLTNCDELSVNLDPSVLQNDLNVDKGRTFHFQNSLFRWDRKNQTTKTIQRFRQDLEDNFEKINQFLIILLQFKDVSAKAFEAGAMKIVEIEKCIEQSLENIINLLEAYKEQQIAQDGIMNAQQTMENNKQWEQQREIKAFKWVEVSPPKPSQNSILAYFLKIFIPDSSSSPKNHSEESSKYSNNRSEGLCSDSVDHSSLPPAPQHRSTSVDDKSSPNKKSDTCSLSSQSGRFYGKRAKDKTNNKPPLSRSLSSNSRQPGKDSTQTTSNCSDNRANDGSNNTSSSDTPVYQKQETKIQVIIPDNEARSHHDYAQQQASNLQERSQKLIRAQELLSTEISSCLQSLKEQVAELRSINRNYDIIEKHCSLLVKFKEMLKSFGDNPSMTAYYDQTVNILSKK